MNKERTRGWLGQPSIIKSLEQKFGDRAMKERLSLTPGTPRFTARRLENPEDKLNPEEHETFRSGVETLHYLTKHSRPDICNPVRELSKTYGCISAITSEGNVQGNKTCTIHKRIWITI